MIVTKSIASLGTPVCCGSHMAVERCGMEFGDRLSLQRAVMLKLID